MSSRKLQQEFDKLQKKVGEGLQQFEDIYEKATLTDNNNQKDKLEGDLRKEIKKLQRSRDQVKQWLSDSSNKLDKGVLLDIRSRIENAMERFKEVEKFSKMKQFSNVGLEMQTKLGARGLDEAKKNDASRYIVEVLDELNRQTELLQAEVVQFPSKKRLNAAQAQVDELNEKIERNNEHVLKLELVLRNLENDKLEPERVDEIRDDLDYYVENNQSADFIEYNEFYDVLELDESLDINPVYPAAPEEPSSPKKAGLSPLPEEPKERDTKDKEIREKDTKEVRERDTKEKEKELDNSTAVKKVLKEEETRPKTVLSREKHEIPVSLVPGGPSAAGLVEQAALARIPPPGLNPKVQPPQSAQGTPKLAADELKRRTTQSSGSPAPSQAVALTQTTPSSAPATIGTSAANAGSGRILTLAQARLNNPLPFAAILQMLESSLLNCPDSFDSEKPRHYNPANVHPLLVDYPQEPMYELNLAAVVRKFDTDTLFFCFYYSEEHDALAKYNAARELSRRGWVFNTQTKQWFAPDTGARSRGGSVEPGAAVESADPQSYKYFDYQSSWLVRRKDKMTFRPEIRQTFL